MKKLRLTALICFLIISVSLVLASCTPRQIETTEDTECRIVLSENEHFTASQYIRSVKKGSDVAFQVVFKNGYTFGEISYRNYEIELNQPSQNGERLAIITLKNIRYSSFVEIQPKKVEKIYSVTILSLPVFDTDEYIKLAESGGSVVFDLYFDAEYTISSIDYSGTYGFIGADSDVGENGKRLVTLNINDITENLVINVNYTEYKSGGDINEPTVDKSRALLEYSLNGGEFIDKNLAGLSYAQTYNFKPRPRPNTSIGTDVISRDGYTLIGWNTQADGSGNHIGLGSRVTVSGGQKLSLYAEWEKWADVGLFEYRLINRNLIKDLYLKCCDPKNEAVSVKQSILNEMIESSETDDLCAVITGYLGGNSEKIVIPEYVDEYEVALIAPEVFKTCASLETLVLPKSMRYVMSCAFVSCPDKLYLYDSFLYANDDSFGEFNISELHINAMLAPMHGKSENGQFANKIDMLVNDDNSKKKVIFFGSCSTWYGVDTNNIILDFQRYVPYNMGIIGGTCAMFQIDLIRQYVNEGDVFIDVAEAGSQYQLFGSVDFDGRVFDMVEGNYDLIASLDMRNYGNVLNALTDHLISKSNLIDSGFEQGSYSDYFEHMSENGDMLKPRPENYDNKGEMYVFMTYDEMTSMNIFENINKVLKSFTDIGVRIRYMYSPLNRDGVVEEEINRLSDYFSEHFTENNVAGKIQVEKYIELKQSLFPRAMFSDTNYHMSQNGSRTFSRYVVSEITRDL